MGLLGTILSPSCGSWDHLGSNLGDIGAILAPKQIPNLVYVAGHQTPDTKHQTPRDTPDTQDRPCADLHHEMCGDGATLACSIIQRPLLYLGTEHFQKPLAKSLNVYPRTPYCSAPCRWPRSLSIEFPSRFHFCSGSPLYRYLCRKIFILVYLVSGIGVRFFCW